MIAGLKEFKNWVSGMRHADMASGDADYEKLEFSAARHLHTPQTPSPLTYQEEARNKIVQFH
ncbi:hypothetical protein QWJ34_09540 [Saccharibacillus sp. CPCC 101409]|uniref:hypothetical protein n=1 Tax=Saccharibacillus sp. CPCC 101409 TaxID=3058041 RepID=UPI0026716FA8|nr:hypothetical protein [Saccharibacillus sp. CPCC 101409]MDO3410002.1 hypothetical protein [Saccharibacillus sp. CPCC 101409]